MSTTTPAPTPKSIANRKGGTARLDEMGVMRLLTAQDRCDRCGAQAFIRATLRTSTISQLFFCNHHAREHEAVLRPQTSHWLDESRWNMRDIHQDVVDDNEERCKSIGAKLKTIDAGLGAADTYMCTTPDGTIVEVPEG